MGTTKPAPVEWGAAVILSPFVAVLWLGIYAAVAYLVRLLPWAWCDGVLWWHLVLLKVAANLMQRLPKSENLTTASAGTMIGGFVVLALAVWAANGYPLP